MRRIVLGGLAGATAVGLAIASARAGDRADGPALAGTPGADIASLYAWMSPDGSRVELVLTVDSGAGTTATFPTDVDYAFHVRSQASYGASAFTDRDVICRFDAAQRIQCWAGDPAQASYVTGDASATAGVTSSDGRLRVFAGRRAEAFFHDAGGLGDFVGACLAAAPGFTFDAQGCPSVDGATAGFISHLLQSTTVGTEPAVNAYANSNVLAIVVSVDRTLLNVGGPILGVHASTHQIP